MNFSIKRALPLIITCAVLMVLCIAGNFVLAEKGIDFKVLMGANILFFCVSLLVFRMQYAALYNSNPQVFIRSVMSGTIIKMFFCVAAIVGYYFASKPAFNKPAIYLSMGIYVIYLVVEVRAIMKLNRTKNA